MMTTQPKKPSTASGPKAASAGAGSSTNRAAKSAFSAVESTRASAENVVKISGNAVKDLIASGTGEMQRAQEKMYEMSRESVETIAKSTDTTTKMMYEAINICRDNIEACVECASTMSGLAKDVSQEMADYISKSFSDQVELSKDAFNCRTMNDVIELQNKVMKQSMDSYFNECMKIYDMFFECATEALEPINQRVSDATEQVSRIMAA